MSKQITNARYEICGSIWQGRFVIDSAALCFNIGAPRYHVWLDNEGAVRESGTLYKNPPIGTRPFDHGHFNTRRLNALSPGNAKLIGEAMALAGSFSDAVDREQISVAAKEAEKDRERQASHRRKVLAEHGEELYNFVQGVAQGKTYGPAKALLAKLDAAIGGQK